MRSFLLILAFAASAVAQSEQFNHVKWTIAAERPAVTAGGTVIARLDAEIDPEWHMYSLSTPPGPIPTTIKALENTVARVTIFQPAPVRKFDPNFNSDTETFEG